MENPDFKQPNFLLVTHKDGIAPIMKLTICQRTLSVLEEVELVELPLAWSCDDFLDLLMEGRRFFNKAIAN